MIVCRYHSHWRLGSHDIHCVDHTLSQVLKLNTILTQCHDKIVKSKCFQHTSVIFKLWMIYWIYLKACKIYELKLAIGWS
jgi:hypothetical protein